MTEMTLRIENMTCGGCVRSVMKALNSLPGTHVDEVRVGAARLHTEGATSAVVEALAAAGFPAHVESGGQ